MGQAAGNGTQAALLAGYSAKTARKQASRLLTKGHIQFAVSARAEDSADVADRKARQRFWTVTMNDPEQNMKHRLRASELLGKSQADFVESRDRDHVYTAITVVHQHVPPASRSREDAAIDVTPARSALPAIVNPRPVPIRHEYQ